MRFLPPFTLIRHIAFALVSTLALISKGLSEETLIAKVDLFKGGENGSALYRIPGIVVTAKGSVLVYCEARKNSGSDWGEIEIQTRRSVDGGRTWSLATQIAHMGERLPGNPHKSVGGENEQTVNNPVAIVDYQTGALHFLYCINYARCFYMCSTDDGVTFSTPVEITQAFEAFRPACDWKVLATGPGHGLQLRNGRLAVPVWLAYGKPGAHAPSMSGTIYSDDHGKTWHAGQIALPNTTDCKNPNETALVELSDGRVMLNARTVSLSNRRLVTISPDGATGWSTPQFDRALLDPQCMGSLIRIPGATPRGRILFSHPHSLKYDDSGAEVAGAHGPRKNLSIQISKDDGHTWSHPKTIEEGSSAYSDLAFLADGTVLCFYERKTLLTLARLTPDWINAEASTTEARSQSLKDARDRQ
jgi:sialidase-1